MLRTTDHIFSLRTLIDKYVKNAKKGKLFCCFIDFQKAFDSIWHDGLLSKLINNKIGGLFYQLTTYAYGLQKQIDILQNYSKNWLLKINPHKTKTLIFQKQNRKATREKFTFFLNGNQIAKASEYTYLGIIFNSNGNFINSKKKFVEKTRRSFFACKRYVDFSKLPITICNKLFETLFLPMLLYSSEVWGAYDSINPNKWEKDPVERLHTQFYKNYLGLNKRAPNVVPRNETGRLSLQLNIFSRMIKFWLHLETLPENSVTKQCLHISHQLATDEKPSFILILQSMNFSRNMTSILKITLNPLIIIQIYK